MKHRHAALTAATLATCASVGSAETTQPDGWHLLNQIGIDEIVTETTYEVRKTFPTAMQDGAMEIEITGYAVPRLPGAMVQELILMSDMGSCPMCGSLDHGANLQVVLNDAIPAFEDGTRLSLRGMLVPVTDTETWQAAILQDARIVTQ